LCSCSWSCSRSSSQSYNNHHVDQDDRKASAAPKRGYLYSEDNDDQHYHCPDKSDTVFATFSTPKAKKKRTQKKGIAPVEKLSVPVYVFVPDREPDFLIDSHVKLDILVDTQEPLSTSHHKIAFEYDEDTVSLVVDPTLSTLDISISDNSNSSAGNASAFEYECYKVEDDTPWFNYHGPKIKILKQKSCMTICTADTIGTIKSQRLFWVLFDSG
jgi:hypothetical protein